MKYVLHVAGMPFDGNTIKTKSLGGSETSGYYVARELAKRGHDVTVYTTTDKITKTDGVRYIPIGEPTERAPLGTNFHQYAENVPHDVLIIQRVHNAFKYPFLSKVKLFWVHDLALKRTQNQINAQLYNLDKILCVSEWHKRQFIGTYGVKPETIDVLRNAVDIDKLVSSKVKLQERKPFSKMMIFSSRPERGLENLVKVGGVMEQLAKLDPSIGLSVCCYENVTPDMKQYYEYLYRRCNDLPNVVLLGHLKKDTLYDVMAQCWLHVYPSNFEETSCITAMESQTLGNPFLCCRSGALPETLEGGGAIFIDGDATTQEVQSEFVKAIFELSRNEKKWLKLYKEAKKKRHSYVDSVNELERIVSEVIEKKQHNKVDVYRSMLRNSDIVCAAKYAAKNGLEREKQHAEMLISNVARNAQEFYEKQASYHISIDNDHKLGEYETHLRDNRTIPITHWLRKNFEKKSATILDYGCCVGQITTSFATVFKNLAFVGADISKQQVQIANLFAEEKGLNCKYIQAQSPSDVGMFFDGAIATEVLEHVPEPIKFLEELQGQVSLGGKLILSVPFGPYEANRPDHEAKQDIEHLHNFCEQDLIDIFGEKEGFDLHYVDNGNNKKGDRFGYWIIEFANDGKGFGKIDYERKMGTYVPSRETLSVCMIARADSKTIGKTIDSVYQIADEIIVGIDGDLIGSSTVMSLQRYPKVQYFWLDPVKEQGFGPARNQTIKKAQSDWILWIDDDEIVLDAEVLSNFLRDNQFDSYGIAQHHFSGKPAMLLKTDYPARLFRNNIGIEFYGLVHEHPEIKLNEGAGFTFMIPQELCSISHFGYETEEVRRNRFWRNFPLMCREREEYKEKRLLHKFLWIRDLSLLNRYEMEKTGQISQDMMNRCQQAVDEWLELLEDKQAKMAIDALVYVTECVNMLTNGKGIGFHYCLSVSNGYLGDNLKNQPEIISAKLLEPEHLRKLTSLLESQKFDQFNLKYV